MKKLFFLFSIIFIFISGTLYSQQQRVLMLNSYSRGYERTENMIKGFKEQIGDTVDLTIEYMDTKRSSDEAYFEVLRNIYIMKYKNEKFDLIVSTDEDALQFLFKYKNEIFGEISVISCGINYFAETSFQKRKDYIGVMQNFDIAKNIDLAIKINKSLKTLYFISDKTVSGIENIRRVNELISKYKNIEFKIIDSVSFAELEVMLKGINDPNSAIIFFGYFKDSDGKVNEIDEGLRIIKENAKVPAYSFWYSYVGKGITGGMVISGEKQGKRSAEIAIEVLEKRFPLEKDSILKDKEEIYLFDNYHLSKYKINKKLLPKGSKIINDFESNYVKYKQIIFLSTAIIIFSFTIIILLVINISKRKKVEEKLNEKINEQELLMKVIEQSPIIVEIADKQRNIHYVNPAYYEITGYNSNDMIGRKMNIPKEALEEIRRHDIWTGELAYKDKNGNDYFELASIIAAYSQDNQALNYIKVGKDITNKIIEEEALKTAKEKAEELNDAKDRFIANISHEIRTPLNGIMGLAEIISFDSKDLSERERAEKIVGLSESLLRIVNDILDFSKLENKKIKMNLHNFNFRELIKNTIDIFISDVIKKNLCFHFFISKNVPEIVYGDSLRLQQIILNICGNAIKFTEKGSIALSVEVAKTTDNICVLAINIEDTGIGISDDKQEMIFDAFTQIDDSNTKKYGGAGLGLAICKNIIENMNGHIKCFSKLGAGTRFSIEIPFESIKKYKEISLAGYEIVILDRNRRSVDFIGKILQDSGATFTFCADEAEAEEILDIFGFFENQNNNVKFIVSDDSVKILELLKTRNISSNVLFLSDSIEKNNNLDSIIKNPINQFELIDKLQNSLEDEKTVENKPNFLLNEFVENNSRVLLIEDNEINIEIITYYLKMFHIDVTCFNSGKQALKKFEENEYDAALIDIQLPEMDGFEITAAIRETEKTTKTKLPIIAITAHAVKGYKEKALKSGMDDYIAKPFKASELYEVLSRNITKMKKVEKELDEIDDVANEMFITLLKIFKQKHSETIQIIKDALEVKDFKKAEHEVHDLKNSLGVLKKKELHKICEVLEEYFENRETDKNKVDLLMEELKNGIDDFIKKSQVDIT